MSTQPVQPPPGYTLDPKPANPPPPPGYTLDAPDSAPPPSAPTPSMAQTVTQGATNFGKGAVKGLLNTEAGIGSAIHSIPYVGPKLIPDQGLATEKAYSQPNGTMQKIGKGVEQGAEFLAPGLGEEAAGLKAAEMAPSIARVAAPLARIGTQALGTGLINKAQGGSAKTGALAGLGGGILGEGMRAIAPTVAESALNVRGNDRLYGRTVGRAILDDTKGVRPGTVGKSAQGTVSKLTPQLEGRAIAAGNQGATASLVPARNRVASDIAGHTQNFANESAKELQPLEQRLAINPNTQQPFPQNVEPLTALRLRRGINSDFINNWRPDSPPGLRTSAKKAYGSLGSSFHQAVPGTEELDNRISSLIPAINRAGAANVNAGATQRIIDALGRPTGALAGAVGGGMLGYEHGGVPEALRDAAIGLVVPKIVSSPTFLMGTARTLNSPLLKRTIPGAALQFDRSRDKKAKE